MYSIQTSKILKDGNELVIYQDYLEFLIYYKQNPKFCDSSDVVDLRNKLSPLGKFKKLLKFQQFIKPTNWCIIKELLNYNKRNLLDFDVYLPTYRENLQRPLVWDLQQKQSLIETILKGVRLPAISVICFEKENGSRIFEIIDGKQRLSTVLAFINNEFPLYVNGLEFYFKDFDEITKDEFLTFDIFADIVYSYFDNIVVSEDDKIDWFDRINFAGTQQEINHINKIKNKKNVH